MNKQNRFSFHYRSILLLLLTIFFSSLLIPVYGYSTEESPSSFGMQILYASIRGEAAEKFRSNLVYTNIVLFIIGILVISLVRSVKLTRKSE